MMIRMFRGAIRQLIIALMAVGVAAVLFFHTIGNANHVAAGSSRATQDYVAQAEAMPINVSRTYGTGGQESSPQAEVERNLAASFTNENTTPMNVKCSSDLALQAGSQIVCSMVVARDEGVTTYAINVNVLAVDATTATYAVVYQVLNGPTARP